MVKCLSCKNLTHVDDILYCEWLKAILVADVSTVNQKKAFKCDGYIKKRKVKRPKLSLKTKNKSKIRK